MVELGEAEMKILAFQLINYVIGLCSLEGVCKIETIKLVGG